MKPTKLRQPDQLADLDRQLADRQQAYLDHCRLCSSCDRAAIDYLSACDLGYGLLREMHQLRRHQTSIRNARAAAQPALPGLD